MEEQKKILTKSMEKWKHCYSAVVQEQPNWESVKEEKWIQESLMSFDKSSN